MSSAEFGTTAAQNRANPARVSYYFRTGVAPMSLPKMLTAKEAAEHLRVGVWSVVELCKAGALPATKPGKQWLIAEPDLLAYLVAHSNQAEDVA